MRQQHLVGLLTCILTMNLCLFYTLFHQTSSIYDVEHRNAPFHKEDVESEIDEQRREMKSYVNITNSPYTDGDHQFLYNADRPLARSVSGKRKGTQVVTLLMPTHNRPASRFLSPNKNNTKTSNAELLSKSSFFLRPFFLERQIRQAAKQILPKQLGLELIIIDDSLTRAPALFFEKKPWVRYIFLAERCSVGYKRNVALAAAAGDIILHTDDDDLMSSQRVGNQLRALLSPPR